MRQTKQCAKCGENVEIVPAGVSKKTGKPYGSFAKCAACGTSEQIGPQPAKFGRNNTAQLDRIEDMLKQILSLLRAEQDDLLKDIG